MIRDPSDGSVKETSLQKPQRSPEPGIAGINPALVDSNSGLPIERHKQDELARLDRSRKWLSDYRTNPERTARLMGETGE